ncbi:MAG: ATP-binding protein [Chryseosolibacter sp.]
MNKARIVFCCGLAVALLMGMSTWIGWITGHMFLTRIFDEFIAMAPLTATCFILVSAALYVQEFRVNAMRWFVYGVIILLLIFSINVLLTVAGVYFFEIEESLLDDDYTRFGLVPLGRMSPITAMLFLFCGLNLFFLNGTNQLYSKLSAILALIIFFATLTVLVGYFYNTPLLYGETIIPIALTTAIGFLAISISTLIRTGVENFPLNLLVGDQTHALLLRYFLPLTAFIILSGGAFQIYLHNNFFANQALAISIVAIIAMILVTIVTIYLSRFISQRIATIEEEKRRLASIVETTPDFVTVYSQDGTLMYCNEQMRSWAGISDRLSEFNMRMFFGVSDHAMEEAFHHAKKEGTWKGETTLCLNLHEIPVSHVIHYHTRSAEHEGYYSSVMRDIRSLKDVHARIESINRQLEEKNAEMEHFVYAASHDLSEPLRMVTSFLKLIHRKLDRKLDADIVKYIDFAVDGAKRMDIMVKDLLHYSRTGSFNTEWKECDLSVNLGEALDNLRLLISQTQAEINVAGTLPIVRGNGENLTRVFQNLIENGIKYKRDKHPVIHIFMDDLGSAFRLAVRDNGIGIEPAHHEQIFQIFKRLHGRSAYSGSGIGLATCKRIIETHGGKIWVESLPGEGSTFYFTLNKTAGHPAYSTAT